MEIRHPTSRPAYDDVSYAATLPSSTHDQRERLFSEESILNHRSEQPVCPSFHPLSIVVLGLWIVLVVGEVFLLERAVAIAPTIVKLPWYYSNGGLPSILFTVFSQGHVAVTAMHLSRIAVSALQLSGSRPRTWLEMFWLTDKKWEAPLGILAVAWTVSKNRLRVSPTIVVFSVTILSALATPLVLSLAYPIETMDVPVTRTFVPSTFTSSRLGHIDVFTQMAVGAGAWSTNLTVLELFNSTTFVPASNASRTADASDLFFAGDIQSMDVSLPGVRIQGGCHAMSDRTVVDNDGFSQLCQQQLPAHTRFNVQNQSLTMGTAFSLQITYCITDDGLFDTPSNRTALVWFRNSLGVIGDIVAGVVRCDTIFTTGTASLLGRNMTYDRFAENNELYGQGGQPPLDPLYAMLYRLTQLDDVSYYDTGSQLFNMLGYIPYLNDTVDEYWSSPMLDGFAAAMWRGATHMTAALAVLSFAARTVAPIFGTQLRSFKVRSQTCVRSIERWINFVHYEM